MAVDQFPILKTIFYVEFFGNSGVSHNNKTLSYYYETLTSDNNIILY